MNPILRNVLAVIAGVVIGSIVNMSLISISGKVIPPPAGLDVTKVESLKASMHLFEAAALVGAFVAFIIAARHKLKFALGVGGFFCSEAWQASSCFPRRFGLRCWIWLALTFPWGGLVTN